MNNSNHASQEELLELLDGAGESESTRMIGSHLHHCAECRQALEALAAQSAIWAKAPVLLKDAAMTDAFGAQNTGRSRDLQPDKPQTDASIELYWEEPLELERPKHPELLGRIGKYDIEREVGRGGMGIVLKAYDAELNRPVAIKVLAPHLANHATARKRFAQEAVAAAGILHPNVIAVYGVNNEGKTPYIVMPYVDGPSLQALVEQRGPLTEIEIVRIALQISSGLAAAHSQGLVHRDIKPANILVEGGVHRVMITDFGLARAEDDASLTKTGWLMGTPNYMSPEQTRGERADPRSDLFSLGSLIYFLATGRLPFRAETSLGVLHRIQHDHPTPVQHVNSQVSKTLSQVIVTLLKKAPDQRFQTAAELHNLLEKHLAYLHQPDSTTPPRVVASLHHNRLSRYKKAVATLLVALLVTMTFGYSGITSTSNKTTKFGNRTPIAGDGKRGLVLSAVSRPDEEVDYTVAAQDEKRSDDPLSASQIRRKVQRLLRQVNREANSERYEVAETLCRQVLELDPANDSAATNLGYALAMQGRLDEALPWHERAANSADFKALGNYNLCCYYSQKADFEKAFRYLGKAIESGIGDCLCEDQIQCDPDLKNIHQDPRFELALKSLCSHRQSKVECAETTSL